MLTMIVWLAALTEPRPAAASVPVPAPTAGRALTGCLEKEPRRGPAPPCGNLDWLLTPDDYPAAAHRAGAGNAISQVVLTIGIEGQVAACSIEISSGFESLDYWACRIMIRRAHLRPAIDRRGRPRVATVRHKVRWVMPPPIVQPNPTTDVPVAPMP